MKTNLIKNILRVAGLSLLTVLTVCPTRADFQSTMLSHNPIGYWRFQETNVSAPLNLITNAGSLGSAANGVCVGPIIKGQPGIIGNSIRFTDPNASGSDAGLCQTKIDVAWSQGLNPYPPFSVEFWAEPNQIVNFSADSTGYCPLSNFDPNDYAGGNRSGWLFYCNETGTWQFRLGNTGGYAGILTATNGFAQAGVWQHIAVTWDGATAIMYVNGNVAVHAAISVANWVDNSQNFLRFGGTALVGDNGEGNFISSTSPNGNRGYDGWIEETAIYTNILSPATVAAHYAAASNNKAGYDAMILAANPVAYWPMHEPSYTVPTANFPAAVNIGSLGSSANGTNYFGTLVGQAGPGYLGFGASDKAVYFDGDNGYCQITDVPGLHWATNDGVTQNYITMAAWVKPTQENFYRNIISHGWNVFENDYAETFFRISPGVGASFYGDGNYYEVGSSDGLNFYDSISVSIPPGDIGNWVYLVGTYDGANWNLYRDGQLIGQAPANTGLWVDGVNYDFDSGSVQDTGAFDVTNWWTIGSRGTDPFFVGQENSFSGWITEPAIFTNALSPTDVNNLYNAAEVPPVITAAPVNPGTVFVGSPVSFSVWADGSPTLTYLWKTNGVSTGVTATNYTLSGEAPGTYTVSVVVSNPYGTNTPSVTFPVVNEPPFITSQPAPEARLAGEQFSFSVVAGGTTPLTYYWKLGSTVVQAGSSATYTATASSGNAGSYTVVVSNLTGTTITSSPATLVVKPVSPAYVGTIYSNGPIAYYRLDETSGTEAFDVVGGNNGTYFNATLGVPGYSLLDSDTAASFSGLNSHVGNISGTAINFTGHTNFTLEAWVNAPSGQADQASIIAKGIGNNGTTETEQFVIDVYGGTYRFFTATRGANAPQAVQASDGPNGTWQHVVGVYDDLNQLGGGSNMYIYVNGVLEGFGPTYSAGLNTTTTPVSIGSKRTGNDPNYDGTFNGTIDEVAIYNKALSQSDVYNDYAAAYGTNLAPFINIQPTATTNYSGLPVEITVLAAGSVPLTYQWYKNNSPLSDGLEYSGSSSATLSVSPVNPGDAGNYKVKISNNVGVTNSVTVPLVVLPPPTSPPVIPGLVMHLTFDQTLNDSTGRGNNGTGTHVFNNSVNTNQVYATNSLTAVTNVTAPDATGGTVNPNFYYFTNGMVGSALHYSTQAVGLTNLSSIGTNDYFVALGVRPDLQFGSNDFSVSYWVRLYPLGFNGGDLPFFDDVPQSTGGNGFVFATAYAFGTASPNPTTDPSSWAGSWGLSVYGNGLGVREYGVLAKNGEINDGSWHNLIHIVDHKADKVTTYLDGVVAAYTLNAGTKLIDAGNINVGTQACVGQDPTGQYGEAGAADIDDLGVWNRALAPLEAAAIFTAAASNQISFTAPVYLTITRTNSNHLAISWPAGTLQGSTNATGVYTNVTGAVSPYIFSPSGTQKFFRVKQ